MRFRSMRLDNVFPFAGPVELDLDRVDGLVVAVVGPNGAGKSTLLGALPAALYRETPDRALDSMAQPGTEARVTVRFDLDGRTHEARHVLRDGKAAAVMLDDAGKTTLDEAKVTSFDRWVAAHLPDPTVLHASAFLSQSSLGLLDLSAADRKAALLRLLRIERLEELAARARARERDAERAAVTARGARMALEAQRVEVPSIENAQEHVDYLRAEVERTSAAVAAAKVTEMERTRLRAVVNAALGRHADAQKRLDVLTKRVAANRLVLDRADEIREALAESKRLQREQNEADLEMKRLEAELRGLDEKAASDAASAAQERWRAADGRAATLRGKLGNRDVVLAAVARLPVVKTDLAKAQAAVTAADEAVQALRAEAAAAHEGRAAALRRPLEVIATDSEVYEPIVLARDALDADNHALAAIADGPARLHRLESLRAGRAAAAQQLADDLAHAQRWAAHLDATRAADEALVAAEADSNRCHAESEAALMRRNEVRAQYAPRTRELGEAQTRWTKARADAQRLAAPFEALKGIEIAHQQIDLAEGRLTELQPQVETLVAEIAALTAEADGAERALRETPPDLAAGPADKGARDALRAAEATLVRAEEATQRERERQGRLVETQALVDQHERAQADWARLAADLGKDGVQALEIDAAGPALTAMANGLLHEAFGPRFSLRIDTTRLLGDGERQKETLAVTVLDSERGTERPAERYSGGERVIIAEALSLALTAMLCERHGIVGPTLVRDESGASLHRDFRAAHVRMLRKGAQMIGASKVLLVTHSDDVATLCDNRIVVADGKVAVG